MVDSDLAVDANGTVLADPGVDGSHKVDSDAAGVDAARKVAEVMDKR